MAPANERLDVTPELIEQILGVLLYLLEKIPRASEEEIHELRRSLVRHINTGEGGRAK